MQTKLFESFETGVASVGSTGLDPHAPRLEGTIQGSADSGQGSAGTSAAIVTRASGGAIYGGQSSDYRVRSGLGAIGFSDLVRESSGHLVLPIDPGNKEDMLLLRHLSQVLRAFLRLSDRCGQRFTGPRINDVGKKFEYMIADELRKTPLEASVLGRPGYPDCMLKQGERVTYLEIKTSASLRHEMNKHLKSFSFSSGKKIKSDARHLLLKVQLEEEDDKIWKVVAWELRDLSALKTRLKTEFNAGFGDLADVRLLESSDRAAQPLTMSDQSILDESNMTISGSSKRRRRSAARAYHVS
jgi:hypothetical protein